MKALVTIALAASALAAPPVANALPVHAGRAAVERYAARETRGQGRFTVEWCHHRHGGLEVGCWTRWDAISGPITGSVGAYTDAVRVRRVGPCLRLRETVLAASEARYLPGRPGARCRYRRPVTS